MSVLRNTSLSWVFLLLFAAALLGQAIAGNAQYNNEEAEHAALLNETPQFLSFARYVVSSHFWQAVMENWQSEYLQFTLYAFATVWLLQRGSTESKPLDQAGAESDADQMVGEHARPDSPAWAKVAGLRRTLYSNSLVLTMGTIFLLSWFAHSVTGWSEYNADALEHEDPSGRLSWLQYLGSADFWSTSLQNWQSEFLAVGSMTVLSIYLRQRGSPESKPVGAAHAETGIEG
jgi:hypothetical protein